MRVNRQLHARKGHAAPQPTSSRRRNWRLAVAIATACSASAALAGPDACTLAGDTLTCSGDQSEGVGLVVSPTSPEVTTLHVIDLTSPIETATVPGVLFRTLTGSRITLTVGSTSAPVTIGTSGAGAAGIGILADSLGATTGVASIPALELLIPDGRAGAGGPVTVTNFGDVTTTGDGAHGMCAQNAIGGYSPLVVQSLQAFDAGAHTYAVSSVAGSADNVGEAVAGSNGGTFTLNANGTLDFEPEEGFELPPGEEWSTSIDYSVRANGQALADATAPSATSGTRTTSWKCRPSPTSPSSAWAAPGRRARRRCSRTCSATWTTCSRMPA